MDRKLWLKLELAGVFVTYAFGIFLHYAFSISNGSIWSIVFGAVNESIWEHIKIFVMPYILWAFIELSVIKIPFKKFVVAKVAGVYSIILSIALFFSAYFGIIGRHGFIFDIVTSFTFIFLSYVVSYKLTLSKLKLKEYFSLSLVLLALFLSMYLTFSVVPPKINLFLDYSRGIYGIPHT